ncbi:MAG: hypothetical protein N5P05_003926 [Chroococcopsis gigantea SAG 12.99]|jgi:predicted aldo/keto reductase-like oxidoreductase|nr:aldo/keto reductase [Chlorogloea purpurea SAG 13.99]MDV3002320.1 hypothetical protein [Chroococcopsis gigantea SAG 12.99]
MRYRRFGKTNLKLSVFSLGTMRCFTDPSLLQEIITLGMNLGINHLETARGYGNSEKVLGDCLQRSLPLRREEFYLTTKLSPTPDRRVMYEAIEESRQRLQQDYIDCVAIHGVNTREHLQWLQDPHGSMSALQSAQSKGIIRHIGFSTHAPLEIILEAINTDLFDFVNLHYYLFWQRQAPAVALAAEKDLGIFIISPGDKGGMLYTPPPKLEQLCYPLSPLVLSYRFLLSDKRITTLSIGPETPEELRQPLNQWNDRDGQLTEEEENILAGLAGELEKVLGSDRCSQCYQCLPCPENINIPEILRLRNVGLGYDMTDFAKYRYKMLENAGHWFPGSKGNRCTECGDCLPRCPEKLDIPRLLRDSHHSFNGSAGRRLWEDG